MNSAANSAVAKIASASATSMAPSFNGDSTLLTINLPIVTAIMSLAVMMFGRMAIARWRDRRLDRPRDPIAGLSACLMVRVWVSLTDKSRSGWEIDVVVTGISLLFTAGWIVMQRPDPFYALMSGTGLGAMGAGIIAVALRWVKKGEVLAGIAEPELPAKRNAEDVAAIGAAMEKAYQIPSQGNLKK